ncbi:MAG: acetoacetyl-CoA reductase [Gammaproteobacteria bacterium]
MKDKIVVVTGGMGGIGTAISTRFSEMQAKVIATYNRGGDHNAAQEWQKQQRNKGFDIEIAFIDVTDYSLCVDTMQTIENRFGRIDVLINNAGITRDVPFYKMEHQQWLEVINTNLNSLFNITRPVINGMIKQGYGRIINISSINAQKGQFGQTNYSAAKAGMHGFTKSLAQEVARKGITVNTISPGYVETDMVMAVPEDIREKIITQIPVGRFGQPQEIANAVIYLASEQSGFITGSNLVINGGHYFI